jgi:hypothetical protein
MTQFLTLWLALAGALALTIAVGFVALEIILRLLRLIKDSPYEPFAAAALIILMIAFFGAAIIQFLVRS